MSDEKTKAIGKILGYAKQINEFSYEVDDIPDMELRKCIMNLESEYLEYKRICTEQQERLQQTKWKHKFELCIEELEWALPLQQFKLIENNETLYINIFRNKFFRQNAYDNRRQDIPFGCPNCHHSNRHCHCY